MRESKSSGTSVSARRSVGILMGKGSEVESRRKSKRWERSRVARLGEQLTVAEKREMRFLPRVQAWASGGTEVPCPEKGNARRVVWETKLGLDVA